MAMVVSHRPDPVVQRFENGAAQKVLAAFSALVAVIGLAELADPALRGTGAFFFVGGVFFTVRALRSSSVVVDESGVSTRSIVRTRRYELSELRGVDVAVGRTGFNGFGREHLVLHRADGQDVAFKELNCRPPKGDASSVVRRAAACINERLAPA